MSALSELDADLVAVGLFEGDQPDAPLADTPGAGDASGEFKTSAILYPGTPERLVVVGLGARDDFDAERARVAGAVSQAAAKKLKCETLAWMLPDGADEVEEESIAAALVEGATLASFEFDRFKSGSDGRRSSPGAAVY